MREARDRIRGLVREIIFENENTGYKVIEVESADNPELITAVGILPGVQAGENLEATGAWKEHATYGEQFEICSFSRSLPQEKDAMERYLASGVIKGVGPALARRIVETFGEETFRILEREPERLAEVKGISLTGACEIGEQYAAGSRMRETLLFLQEYGITPTMAVKIYKEFGAETVNTVKTNPYILADRVQGIGFRRADELAARMGIPPESPARICSAVKYILQEAAGSGHTYLPKNLLEDRMLQLVGAGGVDVENALAELGIRGQITEKTEDEEERVYLTYYYTAEAAAAAKLVQLLGRRGKSVKLPEANAGSSPGGIELSEEQKNAVEAALTEGVLIITGGPGTGKTTIINTLLDLLDERDEEYLLAAPTGRAAKRMTEATGREAATLHRLLELQFSEEEGGRQEFLRDEEHPLEADVIIVDEVSMVDAVLLQHLLRAIPPGARLILAGDKDQLPSVGPGNVLRDMIASGVIPVAELTKIYRQAALSDIVVGAHRINEGQYPEFNKKDTDFFMMHRRTREETARTVIEVVKTRMPRFAGCSPLQDIQVLTPMRRGYLGAESLNKMLQQALNPESNKKAQLEFRDTVFREGDRVMQIKNNYNTPWKICNAFGYPLEEGAGVFNGDIGRIRRIEPRDKLVTVVFDEKKEVEYDYTALEELELAYAITIHKAQGTESPIVVLPLHSGPEVLFTRNLLYTAVTRARKYAVIIGEETTVRRMVDNDRQLVRFSSLERRLREQRGIDRKIREMR